MGNGLSPCVSMPATATPAAARLVYWGGQARVLPVTDEAEDNEGLSTAGDVLAELLPPGGHVVCPADSFFVGLPVPVAPPAERLLPGRTYFVLPAARFSFSSSSSGKAPVLTAAMLASLASAPGHKSNKRMSLAGPGECPLEYVKGGEDGAAPLIRVLPAFIETVITCDGAGPHVMPRGGAATELCTTPELKRHYAQLVGARSRPWSPKLETISERSRRRAFHFPSPARLAAPAATLVFQIARASSFTIHQLIS